MSHDIPNLGIIDGSVFVTSGAVNPTTTICALALRAARHLIAERPKMPRPERREVRHFDLKPAPASSADASEEPPIGLTKEQITRLAELGDTLIPPVDDLSGAGSLICRSGLLGKVLGARPDLTAPLFRALDQPDIAAFHGLAATDIQAWMAMLTVVTGGYYLDPDVRARIGYEGQVARPVRPDNYPAFIAEGLLDHVLADGWEAEWEGGLTAH